MVEKLDWIAFLSNGSVGAALILKIWWAGGISEAFCWQM